MPIGDEDITASRELSCIRSLVAQWISSGSLPVVAHRDQRRRGSVAASSAGIQIELANLVQQRLIADAQHARSIFTAPAGFLERAGDGLRFSFVFQAADQ